MSGISCSTATSSGTRTSACWRSCRSIRRRRRRPANKTPFFQGGAKMRSSAPGRVRGTALFLSTCSFLVVAGIAFCQVAEPPEKVEPGAHDHMQMGAHHMNFPMGEEKCAPQFSYVNGSAGPSHWGGVCLTGKMQSPVDIQNAQQLPIGNLLKFNYQPVDLDVINDCNGYRMLVRF